MSILHLEAAAELDLHASSKLVLMALADDANKITRITYPGMEKLVKWSGVKPRRVQGILDELIEAKLLQRLKSGQPGRKAEYKVFPSADELVKSDAVDGDVSASKQPVDNSKIMGAPQCRLSNNGCNIGPNGCTPECVPPVRPPLDDLTQSSIPTEVTKPVDNSAGDDSKYFASTLPKPSELFGTRHLDQAALAASIGDLFVASGISDDQLHQIATLILGRSGGAVVDPTAYVVASIRRDPFTYQQMAFAMTANTDLLGGNRF